jgi:hypothetical protein
MKQFATDLDGSSRIQFSDVLLENLSYPCESA